MFNKSQICAVLIVTTLLSACSDGKILDRDRATAILTKSNLVLQTVIFANLSAANCLIQSGYATQSIGLPGFSPVIPNEAGKQYISGMGAPYKGAIDFEFVNPISIDIKGITGIADQIGLVGSTTGSSLKIVEFTAQLNVAGTNLPQPIKTCLSTMGLFTAHANMRLYDDGWRLVDWNTDPIDFTSPAIAPQLPAPPSAPTQPAPAAVPYIPAPPPLQINPAPAAIPSPPAGPAQSAMFQKGLSDRHRYESWYGAQSGDNLAGATYWASHRSLRNPGTCGGPGSVATSPAWTRGCVMAQRWLGPFDVLRKSKPDYRSGWNSFGVSAPS